MDRQNKAKGQQERRSAERVRDDQRSGRGSASALSRLKMLERKIGIADEPRKPSLF